MGRRRCSLQVVLRDRYGNPRTEDQEIEYPGYGACSFYSVLGLAYVCSCHAIKLTRHEYSAQLDPQLHLKSSRYYCSPGSRHALQDRNLGYS